MSFEPVLTNLDLPALEARSLRRWRQEDLFHQSLALRKGQPEWSFYEGPPTANGRPGIHHVWARVFKDLFPRFQSMRGHYVERRAGWDCHGLPVELEVEKQLGFTGKSDIESYGIAEFNDQCRESVQRYISDWERLTERIGMWINTDDPYWTMSNGYIESVWWQFHEMWGKSLIYEGSKVVPYCGRCGTALSSHEVAQGYEEVTEDSVYVRFPLQDRPYDLLVWTTTPWTLVSNVAAAVSPDISYVRVRGNAGSRDLVMAERRVEAVLGEGAEIVGSLPVADLVGQRYERPFDILPLDDRQSIVVGADFVTTEDGSGVVHLAPAFGEIDREVCEAEGLPMLNPVGPTAEFNDEVTGHARRFVKDADPDLIATLDAARLLVKVEPYTHSYPHCWRCKTPLIYWAKPTWFAATSSRRDRMLEENARVDWHPGHIKDGRFGEWLRNNVDWALSRDRYWGTPIPVWRCSSCETDTCVSSLGELSERSGRDLSTLDLHRPLVDEITLPCPACSGESHRVASVLDAWFDSGSMPAAQFHYPFENEELFRERFPADFICEAIDQTRGWFYSLLAVNTLVFDSRPYEAVVCLAHIVDQDGHKMSKSKGNVIDPWPVLEERGADALRWYFFSEGSPWTPRRVFLEAIDEATRRTLLTLWNVYSFFVTYANIDGWSPSGDTGPVVARHPMDRWILSRLQTTIRRTTDALERFNAYDAAAAISDFVDEVSNWYVRRSRSRFWDSTGEDDPKQVLYECLVTVSKLLAPFCPFLADDMHRNLCGGQSVHLTDWPAPDEGLVDDALEREMANARVMARLGRAARMRAKVKVRQPLSKAMVMTPDGSTLSDAVREQVMDELNVKLIEDIADLGGLIDYDAVPVFQKLGPRLGKQAPQVKKLLAAADGAALKATMESEGSISLDLDGATVEIAPDEVEFRAARHEELVLEEDGGFAVAIDVTITDELRTEGQARDFIRLVNDMRKDAGLDLSDRIDVKVLAGSEMAEAIETHRAKISQEILATSLEIVSESPESATTVSIEDQPLEVALAKSPTAS